MQKRSFLIALIVLVSAFVLGACGAKTTPTPTPINVEAISTAAAQTVIAQLTQQAPTITPTAVFTDTPLFTATPTVLKPTSTKAFPTAANCANSILVSDVTIPDGTILAAGAVFTKTWRVQNTGTCPWTTNFKLVFSYGEAMGGQTTPLPNAVATGEKVDISVKMTVPNKTGNLTGVWGLEDDKGQRFGELIAVRITVGTVSPTPTGGTAVTPTESTTPKPTKTPTETPTHKPTKTPTATP
jgi:Ig-like domain from next to BRCA1 gene